MIVRIASPDEELDERMVAGIEQDLEKVERRLSARDEVYLDIGLGREGVAQRATLKIEYGRNHLVSTGEGPDARAAVREAREDLLRQINDRSRGGHADHQRR